LSDDLEGSARKGEPEAQKQRGGEKEGVEGAGKREAAEGTEGEGEGTGRGGGDGTPPKKRGRGRKVGGEQKKGEYSAKGESTKGVVRFKEPRGWGARRD